MAQPQGKKFVTGPGHTGTEQAPSVEEFVAAQEQAKAEADPMNRVRPGQDNFDDFLRAKAEEGIKDAKDYGTPEGIFRGEAIDMTPAMVEGMIRELFPANMALDYVTPQRMRDYGVNPDKEIIVWSLQDNYGNNGRNFEDEHKQNNPFDRQVRYEGSDSEKHGQKLVNQGMVGWARPKGVQEYIDSRFNKVAAAMPKEDPKDPFRSFKADLVDVGGLEGLEPSQDQINDPKELARLRDRTNKALMAMLQGSPSAHMGPDNLDRATKYFTKEQTADHVAAARWPGGVTRETDVQNQRDQAAETLKAGATGRKLVSMGATINPQTGMVER